MSRWQRQPTWAICWGRLPARWQIIAGQLEGDLQRRHELQFFPSRLQLTA
ncbi:hypothetical protein [Escherichia coli]|nr:hypothetical protein [Escherichia coli]